MLSPAPRGVQPWAKAAVAIQAWFTVSPISVFIELKHASVKLEHTYVHVLKPAPDEHFLRAPTPSKTTKINLLQRALLLLQPTSTNPQTSHSVSEKDTKCKYARKMWLSARRTLSLTVLRPKRRMYNKKGETPPLGGAIAHLNLKGTQCAVMSLHNVHNKIQLSLSVLLKHKIYTSTAKKNFFDVTTRLLIS